MNKPLIIGLIILSLVVGLGIGYFLGGANNIRSYERVGNPIEFTINIEDQLTPTIYPSKCSEEYEKRYSSYGECELTKVTSQYDRPFIGEYSCRCEVYGKWRL